MSILSVSGFTNLGYRLHSRRFDDLETDMEGRVALVTGGTGGIGLATAAELSRLGATVLIAARNPEKLARAQDAVPGSRTYRTDLSSMADVRRFADDLLSSEDRLDVLVNNVGVLFPERQVTEEGIEATLATNLAGQFLLTNLLIPVLERSGEGRVISVGSGGMYTVRMSPGSLFAGSPDYKGATVYAQTKRGQVILTEMWAERTDRRSVLFHSMHPGWVQTEGVKTSLPTFNKVMFPLLRSPEQGADTIVWLAAADAPLASNGGFWFDREPALTHLRSSTRESPESREKLWGGLVELTGSDIPTAGA